MAQSSMVAASFTALAISAVCVDLSPPPSITISTATRSNARDFIFQTGERFFNSPELKRVYGAEVQVQYRKNLWRTDFNYSYVHPDAEVYAGQSVQNLGVYKHRANLGLSYAVTDHIDVNFRANYYGAVAGKHGRGLPEVLEFSNFTKLALCLSFHEFKWGDMNLAGDLSVKNASAGDFFQPNVRQTGSKEFMLPGREIRARVVATNLLDFWWTPPRSNRSIWSTK